jgi:hypothetical protein
LIGRLPESWIPPGHILDLRARVRTCHLLSHQRSGSSGGTRCSTTMGSRNDTTCSHSRTAMDRWPEAPGRRPRAARPRASDHRRARHPARSVRLRAPRDRTQAAGLSSAYRPDLRSRRPDRGHHPRRARRRPPLPKLPRRRPLWRPRYHRLPIRRSSRPGQLSRQGPAPLRWALYEAARALAGQPRPPLLPAARRPDRRQPRLPSARKLLKPAR